MWSCTVCRMNTVAQSFHSARCGLKSTDITFTCNRKNSANINVSREKIKQICKAGLKVAHPGVFLKMSWPWARLITGSPGPKLQSFKLKRKLYFWTFNIQHTFCAKYDQFTCKVGFCLSICFLNPQDFPVRITGTLESIFWRAKAIVS